MKEINDIQEVIECHLISGGYDYLLKFVTGGIGDYQTIMERLVEDITFDAPDKSGQSIRIDAAYVRERIGKMADDTDLSRFVL